MIKAFEPIYTVTEAAAVLKVSRPIIYELMNSGQLPFFNFKGRKIKGTDLEEFIEKYPTESLGETV